MTESLMLLPRVLFRSPLLIFSYFFRSYDPDFSRLPSDNGNNGNGGLIWGIITGVVIVLLVPGSVIP